MDPASSVLVVIDAQNGFVNAPTRHVVPVLKDLCARWLDAGGALVLTRYHNYPGSPFEKLLRWYKLRDEPDTELIPELEPFTVRAAAVIDKTGYTAIVADLEKVLAANAFTDVLLCGFDTETCVLKSAIDVFEHGLTPWLISDACASNGGEEMHETALRLARRFIGSGQLLTVQDLRANLGS